MKYYEMSFTATYNVLVEAESEEEAIQLAEEKAWLDTEVEWVLDGYDEISEEVYNLLSE
jgi:hypothetical protein